MSNSTAALSIEKLRKLPVFHTLRYTDANHMPAELDLYEVPLPEYPEVSSHEVAAIAARAGFGGRVPEECHDALKQFVLEELAPEGRAYIVNGEVGTNGYLAMVRLARFSGEKVMVNGFSASSSAGRGRETKLLLCRSNANAAGHFVPTVIPDIPAALFDHTLFKSR